MFKQSFKHSRRHSSFRNWNLLYSCLLYYWSLLDHCFNRQTSWEKEKLWRHCRNVIQAFGICSKLHKICFHLPFRNWRHLNKSHPMFQPGEWIVDEHFRRQIQIFHHLCEHQHWYFHREWSNQKHCVKHVYQKRFVLIHCSYFPHFCRSLLLTTRRALEYNESWTTKSLLEMLSLPSKHGYDYGLHIRTC